VIEVQKTLNKNSCYIAKSLGLNGINGTNNKAQGDAFYGIMVNIG